MLPVNNVALEKWDFGDIVLEMYTDQMFCSVMYNAMCVS